MNNKHLPYIRTAIGIVFLVSGFAKAYDTDYFGSIMASYGAENLYVFAPLIIFAELLLGLALVFGICTRFVAALSIAMILILSAIYTYGYVFAGIEDCGCFGRMVFLSDTPWFVYLRNILLLCGSAYIFRKQVSNDTAPLHISVVFASIFVMFTGAFMCGKTFKWKGKTFQSNTFEAVALSEHPLHNFVETSMDSTYMVTVFSYTCPHCLNSIGNMEQYSKIGIVDHVIGIAIENPKAETEFYKVFTPSFPIKNYSTDMVSKLSKEFPISFFIKHDSIIGVMTGEVSSAYFFRNMRI